MKPLILVSLLASLALSLPVRSQPAQASPWLELESRWNDAHLRGDLDALADLWADDLLVIVPKMQPMDKETSMRFWRMVPVKFTQYVSSQIKANELGSTAVVTGKLERTRDFGGRQAMESWQFTKVYAQRSGKWRVIAFHASEAPQ